MYIDIDLSQPGLDSNQKRTEHETSDLPVNSHASNTLYLCMSEILVNLVYVLIHYMHFKLCTSTLYAPITYIYLKLIKIFVLQHHNMQKSSLSTMTNMADD